MALQFPSLNGNSICCTTPLASPLMICLLMNPFFSHSVQLPLKPFRNKSQSHKTALWAKWAQYISSSPRVNELEPLIFILTNPSDKVKQLKEFRIAFIRN